MRSQHVGDLSAIAQELTFLQSNMLKEQKRLEDVIRSKDDVLLQQREQLENLREQNKKLQMLSKAKLMLRDDGDKDMDTPSSEDSSPKASFSKGPKAEIKSRSKAAPPEAKAAAAGCAIQTSAPVATLIAGETEQIRHDLRSMMQTQPDPPAPPPKGRSGTDPVVATRPTRAAPLGACSPGSDGGGNKPPIPSRAAVNKKLQQQQHQHQSPSPPPIPARNQAPRAAKSPKEERIDSGRESDDFATANDSSFDESKMKKNFKEFLRDNMSSYATSAAAAAGAGGSSSMVRRTPPFSSATASVLSAGSNGDEGVSSSHEDQSSLSTPPPPPPPPPRTTSASSSPEGSDPQKGRQLTNHHRAVQKPRDIKYRSKLKSNSTSTLGVLEEHQVVSSVRDGGGGGCAAAGPDSAAAVTTVTYWTEPYL